MLEETYNNIKKNSKGLPVVLAYFAVLGKDGVVELFHSVHISLREQDKKETMEKMAKASLQEGFKWFHLSPEGIKFFEDNMTAISLQFKRMAMVNAGYSAEEIISSEH